MGKITSYKDFKNNVQSIRDELTKQGYTPRSVPSEQKEETKNTKKIEKGKGLFKETGKSSFNDIPKIQELQNEYQKAKDWGFYDYTIDQIKKEELPTKFGNVNMNKRPLIRWNDELKKKYENELKSWGYDPEIGGIDTVFGGSDKFGTDINNSGWNVAYTPIMPDGTFLDKGTVDNYMNSLVKEAYEKNGNVTNEELETLDKKGMQVGDKYVHGIFAGVDGDEKDYHKPYSAEDRGKLMHFSGKYGAINIAKRGTDNLKTNPNEEQSDSDEREEYLNQQVDIPITDNKSISLKYRTVKTIDNFLKRNKEKNKYKKAQQLDEMIDKLDLSENELKNAKSYAGLKKLSLMSSSNGKDSVLKELGQFVAYPIGKMYDFAKRAERTYVKDGFPFKVQQMGEGDYSEQLQELDKYYSENPDELGNDFFNRKSTGNDAYSDYMDNLRKVKAYEAFDNTNPVTHFIAEKGLGSMGQMLAAYGTAGLMGLPDVTEGVSSAAKKVAGGTKIGQVVSKVANATPDIANVAEKGIGSKIANAAINKANNLSIGSAAKFLNPLDNSTTLLMGIDSAQQKYDDLVKNGYDKDTAYKNAMFTGYVNTITEKMGYDGTPESMMFALSPTGSTKKNVGKVLKQYMKANVGEGLEEVYATLFERMGDVVSKVGYVDENGKIQQRKLVGKEGVIDLPALGESFLGGAVGGAVMGGAGVVDTILHTDAKSVRECGDKVRQALSKANKEVSQKVHEAGVEMPELPKQIDWKKSTVPEMKEYFNKVVKVYRDILSDEKVINYDRKVAENTLNKMNTAETGNEVNEATNINNVNATPQTENSIQNVPKTSEIEPLQAVQETAPLNAQVNDISNINTQNSKINADNSTINDTTSEINSVDTLNEIDTLPNISTQENGVQSSVNRVTEEVHNAMNKVGLNVSESATGIQEANTKFMSNNDNLFDRNYVSNYANDFVQAMSEKSGRSYTVLSQETDNLADELVNKTLTGNSVLDGNREFQTVVRNFKDVLREGIKKNANLHNNVYGANEVLNAQVQDIENGDYSSLNITENPNNNVTFAPITENGQNIGYIIERDNGYSNELSESDFAVKQKNGEYGTRNGITYGHFGTHQNSNGSYIVSYLPTGNATAILPNQNSAIEFMKQAENETSGYSIYLHDDNGVTKTGGDMSQFINALNNAKNSVQVEQNSGNVGIQSNTGVSNNAESEKINSQAPNTDENTNTTQTDNAIKSIEISEEDKIPGLLQDEYSDLLSLEDRTALDTLGSAIGVPIKIVPTISNDANGCYYKGVIYISLSADDKVMTVFSHELTHYLEDTLDYTEYKKCVLGFIQKNTDKSIDELVKEKVDTYAKSSINLTYEEATREIVADYTQNILKDADAVMEFVDSIENKEQRRGVIRRLLDAIKELINKIKAKFSSKHSQMQDLQKTHDLLENMLKEATENTESDTGSETRYSFGGKNAKTADVGSLQKAETLEKDGVSTEEIRKATGWSRGLDNKWKFEIDDSKAKYKEEKIRLGKAINLNEVLEHEDLFKAYPDLKKVKVKEISDLDARGVYSPNFDCIFINENLPTQKKLKSLIHEVQHAIQVREGFAVGESPDNENRNQSAGEIEADDVKARQSMSKKERLNTFPKSMKPNQNADVVFWENGKDTNKTKFSLKDNSDNENSNIDEKDVAAIQSIGQLNLKERGIINRYTYNKLAQKADMPVTKLAEDLPINSDGKINRADILAKAMNNVRDKNNLHNTENTSFIYVKDIDKNILVGKDALRHGLMRNSKDTAKVTTKIGDVLENAIKVNELKPRNNTLGGYVLMGIGIDDKGNYYPTRIIVNNYEVQKIEPLDVVYAVRTKKKNQSPNGAGFASKETPLSKGSSKISVSDFLDIVKDNFADTLPQDVLEKYNTKRPKSALSESVKYSIKESAYDKIENRLSGDDLLNAYDTIEEIRNAGGRVDENGYAYVYHNTSKDNAENIRKTGVMSAKEDGIFVSTKPDGQSAGYGNETVSLKIPVEKLVLDDMFDDELHFRIPLKNKNDTLNVSNYLIDKSNADNAQIKSDNFKNWFGDWENNPSKTSKVVNEDGTPKIVYHGTTSNFTTFDTQRFNTRENSGDYVGEGFFFTDKESTAKKYGSSVMPVYLNLRNPLIINTENDGKKFRSTFLNMYQKGNKELRDLIGGDYDYFSIMKENPSAIRQELQRRGYDGLIDNLYGQYAVFNSEQIKSATDNIGTFDKNNADIRYSSQKSKPTTVHSVSKKLISDYGVESKVKPSDISEAIADITSKINDTYYGEGDINRKYAKLEKAAYGVAEKIVDQMKKKDNYAEEIYNNLRKEIKSTKIRISEVDKGDFTEWNDFRKQNFGYLTISNKEGIPVDSYYKELAQEYPGMFDESTHMAVGDQLRNIVDTLRDLKPKEYDLSTEERNEMLEEVANEVILRSINLADDMGYIDKNGNADKIYTENDMRGALDKQKERLNNKHEKQLDRQKERLENKYEKRLETQKAKYIEQREKIRKQLIDKVNQQKEKAKARKKESEDRTKLLKLAREINSMKLSPQDKNKLPNILKEIDTVSKGILKKGYTTKDGKAVMGELDLKQLKEDYELLKQDENFLPDKDVELKISRLDKMQIADMNINDVRDLIQTLQEVKHEIRTKDKMINDVRNREIAHTAMESIKEIQRGKGIENKQKGKWYRGYISTQLTPERMFRRLSGYAKNGVFEGLAKDLSDGQRKSMTFKQRASEKFKTVISKTEEMSKFTGKKAELIDISKYDTQGRKVYITPDMRTSLYLHSKNYSNLKHIQYGGITIPDMDLYKQGKIKDAYESAGVIIRLTPSQVNEITSKMTPFEKQFADVAYNFFNDDCSKAINETSIALKGYEIATVRDYFPIVSNRNFINNDFESLVKNGTLEGKGMLKERKYASNPVALESVIRAINRQMSDVADYYGLAIPIRNFNKVYNSIGRNYNYSVKESLKQKWGQNADKYIENLITDLQSGRKTDGTLFDILKGHYAQGVLSLNLGVTLKQAASYPTAAAVVGYKPLAKAFSERVSDSDRKIIDKYTPLLWYRSQGYTTSEFGDYADGTYEDWTKKGKMPLLMGWIQAMDIATTTKLWKAAEFYVRDNYETLEQGTDEYYKQVADVYNSIIENTQPNYSTMQRPDILRNPNALVKSVTMFKTQVMQNFNILYDAYGEYNARYQDYQSNKTEENAEDLKSAAHNLGKAISSQIIAAIVLNLCDGIGRFLKGKFDDYYGEDDKDKTITLKSAMSAYLTDCFNTVMGTTLGGSETAALVEYILSIFNIGKGAVWYDIQAPALDTINNTVDSLTSLLTTVSKNGASSPWAYVKSINKLLKELGTATGIPLKNGEALLYGIYKNITDWTKKENVFETLDSWTDESKREYTKDDGHKYRANMSIKEYKEYNAYYEKIVKDMQSGKIRKKNGEKYSSNGIKQAARKKANEKFEKLFTEKIE